MNSDGAVVRRRLAYRSSGLNPISPDDMKKIAQLGLKTAFDLRTADEAKRRHDELPADVERVWLNVLWRMPVSRGQRCSKSSCTTPS